MHALFHIKTVIIPRDRYRPEGFSPRVDIARWMITVLILKKACINLFITYFNIELKRTYLTSHTDTKLMDMSQWSISVNGSASETPINLSSLNVDIFPTTINSWAEVTSWGSREAWYRVIRVLPRWQISLWHFRCLRMGKIDVITYKYVITGIKHPWSFDMTSTIDNLPNNKISYNVCMTNINFITIFFLCWFCSVYKASKCCFNPDTVLVKRLQVKLNIK
jgi:hypothetical protein